jgi:hypothetical protein
MNDRTEKTLIPSQWLVKTEGDNAGKIFGWNRILARRADMAPYDGPIDEKGFASAYVTQPKIPAVGEMSPRLPQKTHAFIEAKEVAEIPQKVNETLRLGPINPAAETLDQVIFRLRIEEKKSLSHIGKIVGKSKTAVYKRLRKLGSTKGGQHAF